jgi:hypothetical protein
MEASRFKIQWLLLSGLALIGLAWPLLASARGGVDGGGGGAIHCDAPNGDQPQIMPSVNLGKIEFQIVRARDAYVSPLTNGRGFQLLDLWEASSGFGPFFLHPQKIVYSNESVDQQIARAVGRLEAVEPEFGRRVGEAVQHVRKHWLTIPPNAYVVPPVDTRVRFLPIGCQIVGFGAYSDSDDNLVIDPSIAKAVTQTDLAALFLHEAVYKVLRDQGQAEDSWKTRRIVGLMFSSRPLVLSELENGFPQNSN